MDSTGCPWKVAQLGPSVAATNGRVYEELNRIAPLVSHCKRRTSFTSALREFLSSTPILGSTRQLCFNSARARLEQQLLEEPRNGHDAHQSRWDRGVTIKFPEARACSLEKRVDKNLRVEVPERR